MVIHYIAVVSESTQKLGGPIFKPGPKFLKILGGPIFKPGPKILKILVWAEPIFLI